MGTLERWLRRLAVACVVIVAAGYLLLYAAGWSDAWSAGSAPLAVGVAIAGSCW